jgi:cytoskeletal protein CcmA (bactofilin family)
MFDRNRRSDAPADDTGMDDELDKDRFATAAAAETPAKKPSSGGAHVREAAIIGPSIHINGDLRGEEDLLVEGTVNGTVQMQDNTLTIGSNGHISATVYANSVYVDGKLEGDLYGSDRVAIRKTGSVTGTIVSPRISLDDGGYFKGTMEMDQASVDKAFGKKSGAPSAGSEARSSSGGAAAGSANAGTKPAPEAASGSAASGSGASESASSAASGAAGKGSKGAGN